MLSSNKITVDSTITVSVKIKNTGKRTGDEIPHLSIHLVGMSILVPTVKLVGFQRIMLATGTSQRVTFELSAQQL